MEGDYFMQIALFILKVKFLQNISLPDFGVQSFDQFLLSFFSRCVQKTLLHREKK